MGLLDIAVGVGASVLACVVNEVITWVLVTRKPENRRRQEQIEKAKEALKKMKAAPSARTAAGRKAIEKAEENIQNLSQAATVAKMGSMLLNGLVMVVLVTTLNNAYEGVVAGMLPFEPVALVRNITHRNIFGTNWYECSVLYFYIVSSMAIRPTMQKIFGSGPKRGQSMLPDWALPPEEDDQSQQPQQQHRD